MVKLHPPIVHFAVILIKSYQQKLGGKTAYAYSIGIEPIMEKIWIIHNFEVKVH
ncbi:hypothetical protein [Persephonella sp. IF05-L8]|uniref:hypothetical protein n=1 Tax=Persephonella sp. IF05-L8 TaxID=1158338 RepID=UPI0012DF5A1D